MKPRTVLILAICMGLVTASLVYGYVSGLSGEPVEEEKVAVVVAGATLTPRSIVGSTSVRIEHVPIAAVHPDAIISLAEAEGRIVKDTVVAGEQLLRTRLYELGQEPGLTFSIPPSKRAISVAVNEVIGVAGFVKPGDKVDILATFDESMAGTDMTVTVLQDVQVLAISQRTEDEGDQAHVATTVTLAVTLDEAERLTLAEERGVLRLALRPALFAQNQVASAATPRDILPIRSDAPVAESVPRDAARQQVEQFRSESSAASVRAVEPLPYSVEVIRGTRKESVTLP